MGIHNDLKINESTSKLDINQCRDKTYYNYTDNISE